MGYFRKGITFRTVIQRLGDDEGLYTNTNGMQIQRVLGALGAHLRKHPDEILRIVDAILSSAGQDQCPSEKCRKPQARAA